MTSSSFEGNVAHSSRRWIPNRIVGIFGIQYSLVGISIFSVSKIPTSVFKNIGYRFGISVYRHTTSWGRALQVPLEATSLASSATATWYWTRAVLVYNAELSASSVRSRWLPADPSLPAREAFLEPLRIKFPWNSLAAFLVLLLMWMCSSAFISFFCFFLIIHTSGYRDGGTGMEQSSC